MTAVHRQMSADGDPLRICFFIFSLRQIRATSHVLFLWGRRDRARLFDFDLFL